MWENFDGKPYTREALAAHINSLDFSKWRRKDGSPGKPKFIVLHNTSVPTIALWLSWDADKREQYIKNVEQMYEVQDHWHAGPHYFVPPETDIAAYGFSDPTTCGTHASCFNSDSIGIEMVGEFNQEAFDTGPGAIVRDNAVYLMALLYNKIGITPTPYAYNDHGLHFHIECKADDHDCPGKLVNKADVIDRIQQQMIALAKGAPLVVPPAVQKPEENLTKITATVFGGAGDWQPTAYADVAAGWPNRPGVALPWRFPGVRPKVKVTHGDKSVICDIVDVGPWNTTDAYWVRGQRPQAESGEDLRGRHTNKAGIDLTPAAAKAIGVDGLGLVDWEFAE